MGDSIGRHVGQNGIRKATGQALDRLKKAEDQINQIALVFDAVLKQFAQKVSYLEETVEAISDLVGKDEIKSTILATRIAKLRAMAESSKAALQEMVSNGVAVKAEKVEESQPPKKTLLVLREDQADGTVKEPGYGAMFFEQADEKSKSQLLGQSPGFSFKAENGSTINLIEVYVVDEEAEDARQKKLQEEAAAKAATEATPAEQSAAEGAPEGQG